MLSLQLGGIDLNIKTAKDFRVYASEIVAMAIWILDFGTKAVFEGWSSDSFADIA